MRANAGSSSSTRATWRWRSADRCSLTVDAGRAGIDPSAGADRFRVVERARLSARRSAAGAGRADRHLERGECRNRLDRPGRGPHAVAADPRQAAPVRAAACRRSTLTGALRASGANVMIRRAFPGVAMELSAQQQAVKGKITMSALLWGIAAGVDRLPASGLAAVGPGPCRSLGRGDHSRRRGRLLHAPRALQFGRRQGALPQMRHRLRHHRGRPVRAHHRH